MQKFKIVGKPLLGEKYVEGKKKERKKEGRRRRRKKNNAKLSGQYVRPRTHNVRAHALPSHQLNCFITKTNKSNIYKLSPKIISC